MKRKIFTLLLLWSVLTVKATEKEYLSLFTDRDLYVSGETILLKAFAPAGEKSGIVNIDLVNRTGKKISGVILEIRDQQADGYILIPDSLSSGSYFLSLSTRNNPLFTTKTLYISNRFTGLPESNTDSRATGISPVKENTASSLTLNGVKDQYTQKAKCSATANLQDNWLKQVDGKLSVCISRITPEFSATTFLRQSSFNPTTVSEKEGIIIEGTVTDLKTAQPFKDATVYLSIPDSIPGFQYCFTHEDGRFYFRLEKYYGKIPVVIQCFTKEKSRILKLTLDDPSHNKPPMPDQESFIFTPEFRKSVEKSTDAITFQKIFNQQEIANQPAPVIVRDAYPFYGVANKIVDPQLFIDLPDFNEVSKELLPGVKYRNYNRIPTLQVLNLAQMSFFNEQPLILLDGIPIRELTVIKDMGTKDIDKIEICNSERFFGDLNFPGVVAIYTSKADYTKVPESSDLIKFNLEVIQPPSTLNMPVEQPQNVPDLRQVLLWEPSVMPESTIRIGFQTSDVQGIYKLALRGKTRDGSIFCNEQIFEVK